MRGASRFFDKPDKICFARAIFSPISTNRFSAFIKCDDSEYSCTYSTFSFSRFRFRLHSNFLRIILNSDSDLCDFISASLLLHELMQACFSHGENYRERYSRRFENIFNVFTLRSFPRREKNNDVISFKFVSED